MRDNATAAQSVKSICKRIGLGMMMSKRFFDTFNLTCYGVKIKCAI